MFSYIRYTYICITPAIVNQNQNFCTAYSDIVIISYSVHLHLPI